MKILNEEHFENVRRYAESIGDTSLQKCLERLKSWEENPDCPCEISLYYDHAPYSALHSAIPTEGQVSWEVCSIMEYLTDRLP